MPLFRLFLACVSLAALPAVSLALPDYEPFNYSAGINLIGNTNANGLFWTATGPSARMGTEFTVTSGTVFYSFAFRVADLTGLSTTGGYVAGFNNSRGTQSGTPAVVGTQLLLRATNGNIFNIGLSKASTNAADLVWSSQTFTTNETVLVVGSYTFNSATSSDDVSKLWINPDPSDFGSTNPVSTPLVASTGADISANQIASIVFFQRTGGVQPLLTFADELRLGRTFADVTPTNPIAQNC